MDPTTGRKHMAHDDDQARRSRVVVETPTSRREVTQTETYRDPERNGMSGATVGVIVVLAIALITVVVLFLMNGQQQTYDNNNLAAQQAQQPPVIVQQPAPAAQQPPVIIQQPATTAQQPPIIINEPAPSGGSVANTSNDGAVQTAIDKRINDDPTLSTLGITATVLDGKVTLTGSVASETLKTQVDRLVRAVKGVKQVDNQLIVAAA
jgi:hypothetical protein